MDQTQNIMNMPTRETATILAALRYWQAARMAGSNGPHLVDTGQIQQIREITAEQILEWMHKAP